jgi:FAD/FMN-containing dehydrogenase/Fe-S oxidoreductase
MQLTTKDRLDLQHAFEEALGDRGSVRFDPYHRELYSTDASNHRLQPLGVVIPRSQQDLSPLMATSAELGVPLIARGAGTSLAGQTLGKAVILDCGQNLNSIVAINRELSTAIVEPGVSCLQLNQAAAKFGLMYGPDPASADRATFGGMIGNNATGAHSISYGMTADHVERLWVTLANGSQTVLETLTASMWAQKAASSGLEGSIYRAAQRIRSEYREAVESNWPGTWRRASGYSLNYLLGYSPSKPAAWPEGKAYPAHDPTNLAPLLAGSEGTLALFRQAEVRLVPVPAAKALVLLSYTNVLSAVKHVPELLEHRPAAIELIPRVLLERAATIPSYARKLTFLDEMPEALLVVEFSGSSADQVMQKAQGLAADGIVLASQEAQADLWAVRKAGLGLLMSVPGHEKPITFIEDVAVPVENLAEYVRQVERVLADFGIKAAWYAHASAGCLHLRPMINLRTQAGVEQMRAIADRVASIVLSLNGSMSGEHGDGLSHSEFNNLLFGPRLMQGFHELKRAFDPKQLLNPGKVVPAKSAVEPALDEHLRYGPDYSTSKLNTFFAHQREGSLDGAVEACAGLGVCRKDDGLMCPSFQATREEFDLTRGRANALRAALAGQLPPGALTSQQMFEIYDLCLECKGCKAECPTGVDIARVKAEFLALYGQEHGFSLRSQLFAHIRLLAKLVHLAGPIIGAVSSWSISRRALQALLGISQQRRLPPFQRQTFSRWFRGHKQTTTSAPAVVLFLDSYSEYSYPDIGRAAIRVLEAAGYYVELVERQGCCGRPMISKGLLAQARQQAENNLEALAKYAERGIPVIGLEPSCVSALRDEYLEFFPKDPRATALAANTYLIEEFLTEAVDGQAPIEKLPFRAETASSLHLHTHCHTKALTGSAALISMLTAAGYAVTEIDSGCCGMAGSFGYEQEHYKLSMAIAEMRLLPAVRRALERGQAVTAQGVSCRTQIADGAGYPSRHPIELVADRL